MSVDCSTSQYLLRRGAPSNTADGSPTSEAAMRTATGHEPQRSYGPAAFSSPPPKTPQQRVNERAERLRRAALEDGWAVERATNDPFFQQAPVHAATISVRLPRSGKDVLIRALLMNDHSIQVYVNGKRLLAADLAGKLHPLDARWNVRTHGSALMIGSCELGPKLRAELVLPLELVRGAVVIGQNNASVTLAGAGIPGCRETVSLGAKGTPVAVAPVAAAT